MRERKAEPDLSGVSIEELLAEVARRKAPEQPLDMRAMELAAEQLKADVGHEALLGMIARLGPEDGATLNRMSSGGALVRPAYWRRSSARRGVRAS